MILVTGGNGTIGKPLVKELLSSGNYKVLNIDRSPSVHPQSDNLVDVQADIQDVDYELVANGQKVKAVIHLAQESGEEASMSQVLPFHETNVTATLRLLEFARANEVDRVVLRSSGAAKTGSDRVPNSPFAATKMAAEKFLEVHAGLHGFNATVVRVYDIYGGDYPTRLEQFLSVLRNSDNIELPNTESRYYPAHVDEVVAAMLDGLNATGFILKEVGSAKGISDSQLVSRAEELQGRAVRSERSSTKFFQMDAPDKLDATETDHSLERFEHFMSERFAG